ncbi:hypothetical protein L596_024196 [Steinernema carpocapsae]|uniref:Uncharacterized protein n=1 Tax=Steinernema carpocapsae TaxID=34508 RepID=A0A4U5MG05_STECR|nr:hypothetical protein L596_024196 [Steinernema carpocapsae]
MLKDTRPFRTTLFTRRVKCLPPPGFTLLHAKPVSTQVCLTCLLIPHFTKIVVFWNHNFIEFQSRVFLRILRCFRD